MESTVVKAIAPTEECFVHKWLSMASGTGLASPATAALGARLFGCGAVIAIGFLASTVRRRYAMLYLIAFRMGKRRQPFHWNAFHRSAELRQLG
jgi:hypothetical protein